MKSSEIFNIFSLSLGLIFKHFKLIDHYVVKTDDENIDLLLKTNKDKVKFQQALNELQKSNERSSEVKINNKKITISI